MPVYKYENKKGVKWYYSFKFQDTRYLKRGFDTKKEATLAESEKRIELEKFGKREKRIKLSAFCDIYLSDLKRAQSSTTYNLALDIITRYIKPNIKDKYMSDYTLRDIVDWQEKIKAIDISDTYKYTIDKRMRAIFNHAVKFNVISKSPCIGTKAIGSTKSSNLKNEVWTFNDWKKIEDFGSFEMSAFLHVAFFTGMRFGEIMALQWKDIDIQNKVITMNKQRRKNGEIVNTKTGSQIDYNVNDKLINVLMQYKESLIHQKDDDFLFNQSRSFYSRRKKELEIKYNLPKIRMHDIRHSHATLLINNDVNIHVIAERLGHASIHTTEKVYAHLYDEKKKQVVELLESLE